MWPMHWCCCFLIVSTNICYSSILLSTSSFVICYVQLIFSILHIHILNASNALTSFFLSVHVSALYSTSCTTLHASTFTNHFFSSLFNPYLISSSLAMNDCLPITILLFNSLWSFVSSIFITFSDTWIPLSFLYSSEYFYLGQILGFCSSWSYLRQWAIV